MSRRTPHSGDDPHGDQPLVTGGATVDEAAAALVLVHGRGATARSILGFGEEVAGDDVALLAPQAAGNTWYPNSFLSPVAENEPGRSSGLEAVGNAVETAVDAGIDAESVAVAGFSQGACLASEFVARTPRRYGGLAALSGGVIGDSVVVDDYVGDDVDPLAGTPAFLGCSDVDPHIPKERVHETEAVLEALGAAVETRLYEGMGHGINEDETEYVSAMIADLS
ncbi:phospholipase/carboxylesterase [Halorubrum alkaliphilum]|uniref:Phospholipase/carboxylesterase n=1 Tax=Halorubrum alkaliphilum TaxID=261290 RepID=A0A8T4GDG1_9EURY|nr:dienelactone hydrolase family protein [Halorubrum alkaliphilum]MBP1922534.1 phospholipase/carboxylesterase [Halorubrum alkaliphilum]